MTKIKTSELTGPALDWVVAKCEGAHPQISYPDKRLFGAIGDTFDYSTDWAQGGPIIERESITIVCVEGDYNPAKSGTANCYDTYWVAEQGKQSADIAYGPQGDNWDSQFQISEKDAHKGLTPLIAAMRCYCCSKLGDEVDIPKELA